MSPTIATPVIPADADFFAKLAGFPDYAPRAAAEIADVNAKMNAQAKMNFDGMCSKWLQNVLDHGLAAAGPKPLAPAEIVTKSFDTVDGIWVWQETGSPLGVCPDPDPANVKPSGSITSAAPPSQLDRIEAMLQRLLTNQAAAARK